MSKKFESEVFFKVKQCFGLYLTSTISNGSIGFDAKNWSFLSREFSLLNKCNLTSSIRDACLCTWSLEFFFLKRKSREKSWKYLKKNIDWHLRVSPKETTKSASASRFCIWIEPCCVCSSASFRASFSLFTRGQSSRYSVASVVAIAKAREIAESWLFQMQLVLARQTTIKTSSIKAIETSARTIFTHRYPIVAANSPRITFLLLFNLFNVIKHMRLQLNHHINLFAVLFSSSLFLSLRSCVCDTAVCTFPSVYVCV